MSAREKSDLPKVAEKRANKAASAAAELVERRGGAKENAELQSTVRTQSREAVSQAQARIREAVNRKTEGVECLTKFFIADGLPTIGMQRTSDGVERGLIHETSARARRCVGCLLLPIGENELLQASAYLLAQWEAAGYRSHDRPSQNRGSPASAQGGRSPFRRM